MNEIDLNNCCICCVYNPLCLKKLIKTDFPLLEVVTFQECVREVKFVKSGTISHELNAVKQGLCL